MISSIRDWLSRNIRRIPLLVRVLFVMTLIPLTEYAVLVWLSDQIGFTLTLLMVLFSGVIGAWSVRQQGMTSWQRILDHVRQGDPVGEPIFDGVLILFAGVLLITPGLLTDILGFALLLPGSRAKLRERLARWLRRRAMMQVDSLRADGRLRVMAVSTAAEAAEFPRRAEAGAEADAEPREREQVLTAVQTAASIHAPIPPTDH